MKILRSNSAKSAIQPPLVVASFWPNFTTSTAVVKWEQWVKPLMSFGIRFTEHRGRFPFALLPSRLFRAEAVFCLHFFPAEFLRNCGSVDLTRALPPVNLQVHNSGCGAFIAFLEDYLDPVCFYTTFPGEQKLSTTTRPPELAKSFHDWWSRHGLLLSRGEGLFYWVFP